jgi:peptidoglycan/LPS O-acetylase OafA/YrhL
MTSQSRRGLTTPATRAPMGALAFFFFWQPEGMPMSLRHYSLSCIMCVCVCVCVMYYVPYTECVLSIHGCHVLCTLYRMCSLYIYVACISSSRIYSLYISRWSCRREFKSVQGTTLCGMVTSLEPGCGLI